MRAVFAILVLSLIASTTCAGAGPLALITEQEAKLPAATKRDSIARAGVTRGPKILLVSPVGDANVKAPVHLQLKFQGFGGAKIDLASVKITYLKDPLVDLTERLRNATGAGGVDVLAADIPPGIHKIRVDLQDSNGRPGTAEFAIKVGE